MSRSMMRLLVIGVALLFLTGCSNERIPTPTAMATPEPTAVMPSTPSVIPTPEPTAATALTPTAIPTIPIPSATPLSSPTAMATPEPTAVMPPTQAVIPTPEPTAVTALTPTAIPTTPVPSATPIPILVLTVDAPTVSLSAFGQTTRLKAQVSDQTGQVLTGAQFTWSSSTTSVATVDASGLVTVVGNGAATITATAGSASGSVVVTVVQMVHAVAISSAADTVAAGDTLRLTAQAIDANGHTVQGAEFEWTSGDVLVAEVDDTGLITGVAPGEVAIAVTVGEFTGRTNVVVSARPTWTLSGTVSHGWTDPDTNAVDNSVSNQTPRNSALTTSAVTTPIGRVAGAIVEVINGPDVGRQAITDDNGFFALEGLRQGQYDVQVSARGFTPNGGVVELTSDVVRDFAISHEILPLQSSSAYPDTDPDWLRTLSLDYPYSHRVGNVRVFSDISMSFSRDHAEHLKLVWDFFDDTYDRSRGVHVDAYYTTDPEVFQKVVPHCPTIYIPGARTLTGCYLDYPRWFIIPYQIPDYGTQLHEIGHDFLYATWPPGDDGWTLWDDNKWYIEGTAEYFEGGVFEDQGALRVPALHSNCTWGFRRFYEQDRLLPLAQLLWLRADEFHADNWRTYSQSCMLIYYLEKREPGVLYALIHRINSGEIITNDDLVAALLELTDKSVGELEEAYQSHAISVVLGRQ